MQFVTRKVPLKLGATPLPEVLEDAAAMLDEFAERDGLMDAPVVAGKLRALLVALKGDKPWEAEDEETIADRLHQYAAAQADGPAAARELAREVIINPDRSMTIPAKSGMLLVRICTTFGVPGPFLIELGRKAQALRRSGEVTGD